MRQTAYEHHVGRISALYDDGKAGLALHGQVWSDPELAADRVDVKVPTSNLQVCDPSRHGVPRPVLIQGVCDASIITLLLGERGRGLHNCLTYRIAEYLRIDPVANTELSVDACSSTRDDFPLQEVLNSNTSTWWISEGGSMPGGVGEEWLEFSFGGVRRVSYIGLQIPPMPMGPLSVREFKLLSRGLGDEGSWSEVLQAPMTTLDRAEMQEFAINPPVITAGIRLVCLTNAAASSKFGDHLMFSPDCVGLFRVSFA